MAGVRYNKLMQTVAILGFCVLLATLAIISAMKPKRCGLSRFELERRSKEGNESARDELHREALLDDLLSLKKVLEALVLVCVVMAAVIAFGNVFGVVASVAVALFYSKFAGVEPIRAVASRLLDTIEPAVLGFIQHYPQIGRLVRLSGLSGQGDTPVASRQELEHLVNTSGVVLTADEKRLIINGLHFSQKTVESIMTPRGVVETVKKSDVLGPLMLDELHKTGHSRFPVIDGDIDHVVGMLHIKDLLTLGRKDTETAEQAMEKRVFYINQEQTLEHALAAFIKTRHHLFIVVNGYRETAGILTLEDVMEALLGREIVDEFDVHDDLRVVAARSAKGNNNPPHATNV